MYEYNIIKLGEKLASISSPKVFTFTSIATATHRTISIHTQKYDIFLIPRVNTYHHINNNNSKNEGGIN